MNEEFEREDHENFDIDIESFDRMLKSNTVRFFDAEEFEAFFDHYFSRNKISKAEKTILIGISQHPTSNDLKLRHAQVLIRKKKITEALHLLDTIEQMEPSNPDVYLLKAELYGETGEFDFAIEYYHKSIEYLDPEDHEFVYIDIANEFQNAGKLNEACAFLKKAIKSNSRNEMAYLELLFITQLLDQVDTFAEFCDKKIDLDPYNKVAWFYKALAYYDLGLYEKSVDSFDFVLAIDDSYYEAYNQKAEVQIAMTDYEGAIVTLNELLHMDRKSPFTYFSVGECYFGLEKYEDALHYYRLSIRLNDSYTDGLTGISETLYKLGNLGEAAHYAEKALRTDRNHSEALLLYALIKKEMGLIEDAEAAYERLSELDPTNPDLWLDFSDLYFSVSDITRAIETLYYGVKHMPEHAEFRYRMAAYFFLTGKNQQGQEALLEALRLDNELNADGSPALLYTFYNYSDELLNNVAVSKFINETLQNGF
jgi:tetratricopeptide (TPR) repeat protein